MSACNILAATGTALANRRMILAEIAPPAQNGVPGLLAINRCSSLQFRGEGVRPGEARLPASPPSSPFRPADRRAFHRRCAVQSAPTVRPQRARPIGDHIAEAARRFGIPFACIRAGMGAGSAGYTRYLAQGRNGLMPDLVGAARPVWRRSLSFRAARQHLVGVAYLREIHDR